MNGQLSLKAARVNAGLTQSALAEKLDVNVVSIRRWEHEKHVKKLYLYAIACALKVDPDILRA